MGADKRPLLPTWKQYQKQAPDLAQVQVWHDQYHPAAWAVITGEVSGLVILDGDGEQGRKTRERLHLQPHVRTGSGGSHVYFQYPGQHVPTLNSKTKKALNERYPGLDIRGDGGYAVFCGRNIQGEYKQLREFVLERLDILPADLREMLGLATTANPGVAPHSVGVADLQQVSLNTLLDRAVERARIEGRNNAGFWLAT